MKIRYGLVKNDDPAMEFVVVRVGDALFAQVQAADLRAWADVLKRDVFDGKDVVILMHNPESPELPLVGGTQPGFEILVKKLDEASDLGMQDREVAPPEISA